MLLEFTIFRQNSKLKKIWNRNKSGGPRPMRPPVPPPIITHHLHRTVTQYTSNRSPNIFSFFIVDNIYYFVIKRLSARVMFRPTLSMPTSKVSFAHWKSNRMITQFFHIGWCKYSSLRILLFKLTEKVDQWHITVLFMSLGIFIHLPHTLLLTFLHFSQAWHLMRRTTAQSDKPRPSISHSAPLSNRFEVWPPRRF